MDRLKIYVLNHLGEGDGIFTTYISVEAAISFLRRQQKIHRYSIIATKENRVLMLNRIDAEAIADLNKFATSI
jgi:hypothetical protein